MLFDTVLHRRLRVEVEREVVFARALDGAAMNRELGPICEQATLPEQIKILHGQLGEKEVASRHSRKVADGGNTYWWSLGRGHSRRKVPSASASVAWAVTSQPE
jgi:hypothetical protein